MAGQANIPMYAGDDFSADVTVTNVDGSNADLTGYVAQSQVRPSVADTTTPPLAQFTCTINGNVITMVLTHDQTKLLIRPNYFWDIQVIDPNGIITTLLYGQVQMTQEVTKIYTQAGLMVVPSARVKTA